MLPAGGDFGIASSGSGGEAVLSVPVRVVAADPLPSSYRDLEWDPPTGKTVTAYRVYYTEPGGAKTLYGTYAGNVESVRVGDLSALKIGTKFDVEADYLSTATGFAFGDTGAAPLLVVRKTSVMLGEAVNGMYEEGEPIDGPIPAEGRTYSNYVDRLMLSGPASGLLIYGVSFLLGNGSESAISGGKIAVAVNSIEENGNWTPLGPGGSAQNTLTGDALTGWALAAIGGDTSLPIPAATADALAMRWTDPVPFSTALPWHQKALLVRGFVPQRSVAPYLLTYANWGIEGGTTHFGVLPARSALRNRMRVDENNYTQQFVYWDGDAASAPAAFDGSSVGTHYSPQGFWSYGYGPPGPGSVPILAIHLHTEPLV